MTPDIIDLHRSNQVSGWNRVPSTAYDANSAGEAAPETVFVSARQVREELFAQFTAVRVERHNFDPIRLVATNGLGSH